VGAGQNGEAKDLVAAKNLRLDLEMGIVLVGGRRELSTGKDKERDESIFFGKKMKSCCVDRD
jgi:hypothetical protein